MSLPTRVRVLETGPRDGLQNEPGIIDTAIKVELIERLVAAGVRDVEAGAFVNPKWVPQMAGSEAVFAALKPQEGVKYSALTPNLKGFERAAAAGVSGVSVFAAASEAFSQKNTNCSIEESYARFEPVLAAASEQGIPVRGVVSCVVGCPYEGAVDPATVAKLAARFYRMGCCEIALADTIGVGTPRVIQAMIEAVAVETPIDALAVHFHDTYGQGVANVYAALEVGISVVDTSVAGLGGCPYAPGASGNVASEDVVYLLNGLGIETGIDVAKLASAGNYISSVLGRPSSSRVAKALAGKSGADCVAGA